MPKRIVNPQSAADVDALCARVDHSDGEEVVRFLRELLVENRHASLEEDVLVEQARRRRDQRVAQLNTMSSLLRFNSH